MKAECNCCGKVISNPFVDTDNKGKLYFFCNKRHRDLYEERMVELAFFMNPFSVIYFTYVIIYHYIKEGVKWLQRN